MILSRTSIIRRITEDNLLVGVDPANINGASVDLTLGGEVLREMREGPDQLVDLGVKENIPASKSFIAKHSALYLAPGDAIICCTQEIFNLPLDVAAEFRLKSSASRNGLNLSLALWCDPGWHGSVLTFTLHNTNRYSTLKLRRGMKIGQAIFHQLDEPVPADESYAAKGQYNKDTTVTGSKGIR